MGLPVASLFSSHTSVSDIAITRCIPRIFLCATRSWSLRVCVPLPSGEAGHAVGDSFHCLPTRSNCFWYIGPLEADFNHAFRRLLNLHHRPTERLDHGRIPYLFRPMVHEEGTCDTEFDAGLLDETRLAFSAEPTRVYVIPLGCSNHYLAVPAPHHSAYDCINHRNFQSIQTR